MSYTVAKRLLCGLSVVTTAWLAGSAQAVMLDLIYEFDGNANAGNIVFGTVDLTQNGSSVDVTITANTVNLGGGDIHEFYFNLPNTVDVNTLALSSSGGVSSHTINAFTLLGANPSIAGGAGSSYDAGVSFGNGGGPPGNGTLTTATFSLTASGGLLVTDLLAEASSNNNTSASPLAVHFQGTSIFNATSETVGVPEPASVALLGLGGLAMLRRRL